MRPGSQAHSPPFSVSPFREENLGLQSLFCPQICKRHSPICLIVCWIRLATIQPTNLESNPLAASPPLEANQLESIGRILWGDQHTCPTRGALTVIEAVRFECRLYGPLSTTCKPRVIIMRTNEPGFEMGNVREGNGSMCHKYMFQ